MVGPVKIYNNPPPPPPGGANFQGQCPGNRNTIGRPSGKRSGCEERSLYLFSIGKAASLLFGVLLILVSASTGEALAQSHNATTPAGGEEQQTGETSTEEHLQWEGLTTLIIRNNDVLETLHLYGLEQLTTLVIKTNGDLEQLEIADLPQLTNITISNNDKLESLEGVKLSNLAKSENLIQKFQRIIHRRFNQAKILTIKHNDCLEGFRQPNLKNLRELKIEGNDRLNSITLGLREQTDTQSSQGSNTPAPDSPHTPGEENSLPGIGTGTRSP